VKNGRGKAKNSVYENERDVEKNGSFCAEVLYSDL